HERVRPAADLARHAARLEAQQRLGRTACAQVGGDELRVADGEHQLATTRPDRRSEALAPEDRRGPPHLAAGRTDLEQVPRWPGRDRATGQHEATEVRAPAARAAEQRARIDLFGPVRDASGRDTQMSGA